MSKLYADIVAESNISRITDEFRKSCPQRSDFALADCCRLVLNTQLSNSPKVYLGSIVEKRGTEDKVVFMTVHGQMEAQNILTEGHSIVGPLRVIPYERENVSRRVLLYPPFQTLETYKHTLLKRLKRRDDSCFEDLKNIVKGFLTWLFELQKKGVFYGAPIFVVMGNEGAVLYPYFATAAPYTLVEKIKLIANNLIQWLTTQGWTREFREKLFKFKDCLNSADETHAYRLKLSPFLVSGKDKFHLVLTLYSVLRKKYANRLLIFKLAKDWRAKLQNCENTELINFYSAQKKWEEKEAKKPGYKIPSGLENTGYTFMTFLRNFIMHECDEDPNPQQPNPQLFQLTLSEQSLLQEPDKFWNLVDSKICEGFLEDSYTHLINAEDRSGRW